MSQSRRFRALGMPLSMLVVIAALSVLGYSMQNTNQAVRASGGGGGGGGQADPCYYASGSTRVCQFKGFSTKAFYSSVDKTTCASGIYTDYSVYATDNVVTDPAYPTASGPMVTVFYGTWDSCNYRFISNEATAPADLQTTGNLGSANLQATVQLYDWSNNPGRKVTVNLTWVGLGPLSTTVDNITDRTGDSVFRSRFTGSDRLATVTGTISDGTTTVNIDDFATMYDAKGGTITIEHA